MRPRRQAWRGLRQRDSGRLASLRVVYARGGPAIEDQRLAGLELSVQLDHLGVVDLQSEPGQ